MFTMASTMSVIAMAPAYWPRPIVAPTAASIQIIAAVVTPWTRPWRARITPPPRKPTPEITPASTRDGSPSSVMSLLAIHACQRSLQTFDVVGWELPDERIILFLQPPLGGVQVVGQQREDIGADPSTVHQALQQQGSEIPSPVEHGKHQH